MPITVSHELTPDKFIKGDTILELDGQVVKAIRTLDKNVDVTFMNDSSKRVNKLRVFSVLRNEATLDDKIADYELRLAHAIDSIKTQAAKASLDELVAEVTAQITKDKDPSYTLRWHTEEWLKRTHIVRWWMQLHRLLNDQVRRDNGESDIDIIDMFLEHIARQQRDWRPTRSTSDVTNLDGLAEYEAMRDFTGTFGSHGFSSYLYYRDELKQLRILRDTGASLQEAMTR